MGSLTRPLDLDAHMKRKAELDKALAEQEALQLQLKLRLDKFERTFGRSEPKSPAPGARYNPKTKEWRVPPARSKSKFTRDKDTQLATARYIGGDIDFWEFKRLAG